ncbi:Uncharacterized membrane protein [Roseovarius lutimaris]|uniref:Uncharacterized membrane protein n=1 Tax=Roseovarius lutimaris TaxID=1005928 RepID=A0A1I5A643_9RHOB|nr:anthrone oxygenase family protein [Roseovarius lutimaris]SFN57933.1 Uncharacterized membrane protein [Roseovarius lutimaris]
MTHMVEVTVFASAALVMALVAGVFLAFSDFVMRSLRVATLTTGVEAMQQINRKVYGSVFLVGLLGLAPVSLGLAGYGVMSMSGPAAGWIIVGGLIYFAGTFLVTMLGNVPMNQRLDHMVLSAPETRDYWQVYARDWTRWNHLRTAASAIGSACLLIGLVLYA